MKKTDKKIDKKLRSALTEVCEIALENVIGFKWLTHFINNGNFPDSLSLICVFDTRAELLQMQSQHQDDYLCSLIKDKLAAVDINVRDIKRHVNFDTEEDCRRENAGNWRERSVKLRVMLH
jgi:hypothetical protein